MVLKSVWSFLTLLVTVQSQNIRETSAVVVRNLLFVIKNNRLYRFFKVLENLEGDDVVFHSNQTLKVIEGDSQVLYWSSSLENVNRVQVSILDEV